MPLKEGHGLDAQLDRLYGQFSEQGMPLVQQERLAPPWTTSAAPSAPRIPTMVVVVSPWDDLSLVREKLCAEEISSIRVAPAEHCAEQA